MTGAVLEPCPPDARMLADVPVYGGWLFYNPDTGLAGCGNRDCGWRGVPTITGGPESPTISTRCPVCESTIGVDDQAVRRELRAEFEHERRRRVGPHRVPRNQPCPCGSGAKAKKCDCSEYAV